MSEIELLRFVERLYHLPPWVLLLFVAGLFLLVTGGYYAFAHGRSEHKSRYKFTTVPAPHAPPAPASEKELFMARLENAVPAAPQRPEQAPAAVPENPSMYTTPSAVPLVAIVEDRAGGTLAVEVLGRRYASLQEVPEALRPQVARAIDTLVKFGLAMAPAAPAGPPRAVPPAARAPRTEKPARPAPAAPAVTAADEGADALRATRERLGRISALAGTLVPEPVSTTPAFFDAINLIIARRLGSVESLRGREVRMRTSAQGDLQVVDGAQVYPSVDEITDPAVREIVRASIKEWEAQS